MAGLFLWAGNGLLDVKSPYYFAEYCLRLFSSYSLTFLIKNCSCFKEEYDPQRSPKDCGKSATDTKNVGL